MGKKITTTSTLGGIPNSIHACHWESNHILVPQTFKKWGKFNGLLLSDSIRNWTTSLAIVKNDQRNIMQKMYMNLCPHFAVKNMWYEVNSPRLIRKKEKGMDLTGKSLLKKLIWDKYFKKKREWFFLFPLVFLSIVTLKLQHG